MKTLKSITEDFFTNTGAGVEAIKDQILQRLKTILVDYNYYAYIDSGRLREDRIKINDDMTVDILSAPRGELKLNPDKNGIGFQFGEVNVERLAIRESAAINLEGLPKKYTGSLTISLNKNLKYISNEYGCNHLFITENPSLESIAGGPKSTTSSIYISRCPSLKSLAGCPKTIGGDFTMSYCDSIKSLKSMPNIIGDGRKVELYKCNSLTSTSGLPQNAKIIELKHLPKLKKLEDIPANLHSFDCSGCTSLTSLEGGPKTIDYRFACGGCTSLTSLEGGPITTSSKGGYYFVDETGITNLVGCPKKVFILDCRGCKSLSSLEGFPDIVTADFRYYGCPNLKFKKSNIVDKVGGNITGRKNG